MTREPWVSSGNRVMQNEVSPEDLKEDTATETVLMDREEWMSCQKHAKMSKVWEFLQDL